MRDRRGSRGGVTVGLAVLALLAVAASASAGPGGGLAGEVAVQWSTGAGAEPGNVWDGALTLALEPGTAATSAAVTALRNSGRTVRPVRPFFVQSSRITALSGHMVLRSAGDFCIENGMTVPGEQRSEITVTGVTQPLVPLTVDQPQLDLLRGKGSFDLSLYTDNPGFAPGSETYPLPEAGGYFMPVPGTATATVQDAFCGDTTTRTEEGPVLSTQADALVPFAFALWLNEVDVRLVRRAGVWEADTTRTEQTESAQGEVPLSVTYRVRLRTTRALRALDAQCHVPSARRLRAARTRAAALALVRRAGFPRARFRGDREYAPLRPGRFFVDPYPSSGYRACGARLRVFRATRPRTR